MRFLSIDSIQEGMVVAKPVWGKNDELLINRGAVLFPSYIRRLKQLGYMGIYIEDELSKDITVPDIIDDSLRLEALKALKNTYRDIEEGYCINPDVLEDLNAIVNDMAESVLKSNDTLVGIMELKSFDNYTFYHCINVCILSLVIGKALNFPKEKMLNLGIAAILHDVGKILVPKDILNKCSELTSEEFDTIKNHSTLGYRFVKEKLEIPCAVYAGILHHHEKYDGTGYPMGIKSNKISLFGRIISVADVYDAFLSDRPYRNALPPFEAVEYLMGNCGSAFDPKIVKVFSSRVAPYPVGTSVVLSNNKTGLVVENYPDYCIRPRLKIYKHGDTHVRPYFLDLRNDKSTLDVVITGIV